MKADIRPRELFERIQNGEPLRIIDVRSPLEFRSGHVPGAKNIPLGEIGSQIPDATRGEPIVMVCQGGVRSETACQKVMASHDNLFNLVGGTSSWRTEGLPVETPPKAPRSLDRQTHLVAGLLLACAFALSHFVSHAWIYLGLLPTFGLLLDGTVGFCAMSVFLKRAPWNAS